MLNLYLISDTFNGFLPAFLDAIILLSFLAGIMTIIAKNPIISVLNLIGLFSVIALYLILVGIKFIGISYLLVYVGAVSILFLFILMLINIRVSELSSDTGNYIPLAILTVVTFYVPLSNILPAKGPQKYEIQSISGSEELNYVSSSN